MSLKVDHQTISQELKQTQLRGLKLFFAAIEAYPDDHPYVSALTQQFMATGSLITHLRNLYDSEVVDMYGLSGHFR